MSILKKKKPNTTRNITRDELIRMGKDADIRAMRIEEEYKSNTERILAEYKDKELSLKLAEADRDYLGKKSENDRNTKREIEDIQRALLDEIKTHYVAEQHAIMREYATVESAAKESYRNKEHTNLREYTTKLNAFINKYNKKLQKYKYAIPQFEPPTVGYILKTATILSCKSLVSLEEDYTKNKKVLKGEYKKTKDAWGADTEAQIYSSLKELESEYEARCARYKYKYDIERYSHINTCGECKTSNFTYIPQFNPKNKQDSDKIGPLTAYFKPILSMENVPNNGSTPILQPSGNCEVDNILAEFARNFILAFVEFYNAEILRIRDYEIAIPKEQNLVYTILHAEKIWTKVKSMKILDLRFNEKTDDEKVANFRKQEDKFYKDFPIVARYMICLDTYNRVAFRKFLVKLIASNQKKQERSRAGLTSEGESENTWIELQADYVKYLYQEYNKTKHLSQAELRRIWTDTYELLKKEFGDFRKLYDQKVKQIEEEKKAHNAEMAKEVLDRLTTIQSVDGDTQYKLYLEMQNTLFMQRANKNLKKLIAARPQIAGIEGKGHNKEIAKHMERDKKMKEAKNKMQPEQQIKNPVKYYYDNLDKNSDVHMMTALRDLCYLHNYHEVQYELYTKLSKTKRCNGFAAKEIEGSGKNAKLADQWKEERAKWIKEHGCDVDGKIHIPYTRNLVRMYYDNGCRFEV